MLEVRIIDTSWLSDIVQINIFYIQGYTTDWKYRVLSPNTFLCIMQFDSEYCSVLYLLNFWSDITIRVAELKSSQNYILKKLQPDLNILLSDTNV